MQYKVKIDQQLLTELLTGSEPSSEMIKELKKVITVVMIKHFSKFLKLKGEFESFAMLAVLERREKYDASWPAYNYIYTICRNEIGNKINKLSKETFVEDILPISNASVESDIRAELPSELKKFRRYLTGEQEFSILPLSPVDAINLSVFINLYSSHRKNAVPEFIKSAPGACSELYRVIQHLYDE